MQDSGHFAVRMVAGFFHYSGRDARLFRDAVSARYTPPGRVVWSLFRVPETGGGGANPRTTWSKAARHDRASDLRVLPTDRRHGGWR
jgi:hypothetical protein